MRLRGFLRLELELAELGFPCPSAEGLGVLGPEGEAAEALLPGGAAGGEARIGGLVGTVGAPREEELRAPEAFPA